MIWCGRFCDENIQARQPWVRPSRVRDVERWDQILKIAWAQACSPVPRVRQRCLDQTWWQAGQDVLLAERNCTWRWTFPLCCRIWRFQRACLQILRQAASASHALSSHAWVFPSGLQVREHSFGPELRHQDRWLRFSELRELVSRS